MVLDHVQLQVSRCAILLRGVFILNSRFPLDIVFRIYDNVLASGIEALFSFSLCLLYKNEETLLNMKFDQLLVFLNTKMLDIYQVSRISTHLLTFLTFAIGRRDRRRRREGTRV